jgi:polyadenylate-binding protein
MNYAQQKKKKPSPPPPLMPGPTFNMFVANLPFEAKSKDLKEFFIAEGADVVSAEVIFQDNHSNLEKKLKRPFLLSLTR